MSRLGLHAARQGGQLSSPARTGLTLVREVPSGRLVPRGGTVVGLAGEGLCTGRGGLTDFAPPFRGAALGSLAIQR